MSDEDAAVASEENSAVADQEEPVEALTLEQRQDELKNSRWNVFLWLGIAVLMFSFALFPMPFSADYDDFGNSAEKDIGFVWGPSLPGDDLFDASMNLDVTATSPPQYSDILIEAYALKVDNCQQNLAEFTVIAKNGTDHAYQHQIMDKTPITGQEYTFEFSLDPGQYCIIVQYVYLNGSVYNAAEDIALDEDQVIDLAVSGKVWSSQTIGGLFGILCLSLSAFAFIGAQKHGAHIKKILEDGDESTETKVLASVSSARIAAGPSGPPGAGPSGPPPSAGPSGPPPADEPSSSEPAPVATDAVYEPAENGYFFKKLPDGTYDQTVYVQNADGTYAPHQG
ncbi:MAG: hypothetical protein HN458_06630 [Euryarchaeota archaeon]|jgi:hypothetical protein|nr:hypothetical protein [Euryarchaeota archaeon]